MRLKSLFAIALTLMILFTNANGVSVTSSVTPTVTESNFVTETPSVTATMTRTPSVTATVTP